MPLAKLNTTAVTTSQPPHMISAARVGSVRGARLVMHERPAPRQITAAGSSHAMSSTHPAAEQPRPADVEVQVAEPTGLVAGQPAETVVAQRQFDDAVVLRATDVRPRGRRPQFDEQQIPPAGHHDAPRQATSSRASRRRSGRLPATRYAAAKPGSTRNACSILARKPKPTAAPARDQPPTAAVLFAGALHAVGARDQQQHQQRVGIVEPEHQRGDGRQRQHRAGEQRRAGPADPPHRGVEQRDRGDALPAPAAPARSTGSARTAAPRRPSPTARRASCRR